MASGVKFLNLKEGIVEKILPEIKEVASWPNMVDFQHDLKVGSGIKSFKTGLDRYGQFIIQAKNREELDCLMEKYNKKIESFFVINK